MEKKNPKPSTSSPSYLCFTVSRVVVLVGDELQLTAKRVHRKHVRLLAGQQLVCERLRLLLNFEDQASTAVHEDGVHSYI